MAEKPARYSGPQYMYFLKLQKRRAKRGAGIMAHNSAVPTRALLLDISRSCRPVAAGPETNWWW